MHIVLGVDTLSYHCRLAEGEITLEDVFREIGELEAAFVQVNAVHVRERTRPDLEKLRGLANDLGLTVTLSGDVVGRAGDQDSPQDGVRRLAGWAGIAAALGSPFVRVSSGFYRNELMEFPERIAAEQRYIIDTLRRAVEEIPDGPRVLLENHSDFTADEYVEILEEVGGERVGVFLDLINPLSTLLDPLPVVRRLAPLAPAGHAKDFRIVSRYVEDGFHRRGFDVQWCYPGEGVADLRSLVGELTALPDTGEPYLLSVEGLDNHPGISDQRDRLTTSLQHLQTLVDDTAPARAATSDGVRWRGGPHAG